MNKTFLTVLFITISIVSGCSTSQLYHSVKQHQVDQCQKATSNTDYNDCMKGTDKTFNEYGKHREESLTK